MSIKFYDDYIPMTTMVKQETSPGVIHRATCPVCGKKLVNLYWHNKNWQCKKCMNIDRRLGYEY